MVLHMIMKHINFKRILFTAIAAVLFLSASIGLLPMQYDAAAVSVTSYNKASNVIETMYDLGIINGIDRYDALQEKLDVNVTRAEISKLVYHMFNGDKPLSALSSGVFYDVPASHPLAAYVSYAVKNGIMAPYPNSYFKPDSIVTYAEAVRIFTDLYYGANTFTFPYQYIAKAQGAGLLTKIRVINSNDPTTWSRPVTKGSAYNFIQNLLINAYYDNASGRDILSERGLRVKRAKLIGTQYTHDKNIFIPPSYNAVFEFDPQSESSNGTVQSKAVFAKYDSSLENLVGYNVYIIYEDSDKSKTFNYTQIKASDVYSGSDKSLFTYYTAVDRIVSIATCQNSAVTGKLTELKMLMTMSDRTFVYGGFNYILSSDFCLIVNGVLTGFGFDMEPQLKKYFGTNGNFTFVDTNDDGAYDTCIIEIW